MGAALSRRLATTVCASPPALPNELIEEILFRLPPDDPACLLHASLICKAWSHTASRPGFRRRLHKHHGAAPVLGFLHDWNDERIPHFVPTAAPSFSLAAPDWRSWRAIDCRHGRALFRSKDSWELLVWEPITGAQQRLALPPAFEIFSPGYAVFCAADGCDHRDCLGGPFGVAFVFCIEDEDADDEKYVTSVRVYSSEHGTWGQLISMRSEFMISFENSSSGLLIGRSLLYFLSDGGSILECDLARHGLTEFDAPNHESGSNAERFTLMVSEDGGLGLCEELDVRLKLWTREVSDRTDARWVLNRVIHLHNLLPKGTRVNAETRPIVLGFAEGANVIFANTFSGLFTIELQSDRVKKVCHNRRSCNLIPIVSFYTPVDRGEYQDLLSSIPSQEVGDVEGGEEVKTEDEAHQLLDKGSNTMKEWCFVDTFERLSHDLNTRVPCQGEGAPEGSSALNTHGCALLSKDSFGDVPKSSPNEELVKGTTNIDDDGSSMILCSNVEGASPSEKDLKEQIPKQKQEEERKGQHKEKK
ncbi:hypothetical protein CFC21_054438 [Triticum aestivum]|uniref:F-box domain-containing protein n=3 Tax=Triticum TaxID=4564 RepID=A0A9R0SLR7_TRITD|nr:uncharacterized protein LOC123082822 [Triticum aestivum]KAF7045321.1 hypothetical protein CFC21_054438 [Triticum aestivum]VAH97679.1 unnamed protein product [Triticum turgidum subsp. durum]